MQMPTGVVLRRTADLVPYANNARTHTPEQGQADRRLDAGVRAAFAIRRRAANSGVACPLALSGVRRRHRSPQGHRELASPSARNEPVLAEAAGRLAAAIEAGDDLAVHVETWQAALMRMARCDFAACGSVHRSRDFGISRRGDALDAARPRLYHGLESLVIAGQERLTDWLRIPAPPCLHPIGVVSGTTAIGQDRAVRCFDRRSIGGQRFLSRRSSAIASNFGPKQCTSIAKGFNGGWHPRSKRPACRLVAIVATAQQIPIESSAMRCGRAGTCGNPGSDLAARPTFLSRSRPRPAMPNTNKRKLKLQLGRKTFDRRARVRRLDRALTLRASLENNIHLPIRPGVWCSPSSPSIDR